jgi:hypothetical protein
MLVLQNLKIRVISLKTVVVGMPNLSATSLYVIGLET